MKKKLKSMTEIIQSLKQTNNMTDSALDVLQLSSSDITADMLKRLSSQKRSGHLLRTKYGIALRKFAMTLNFYSTRAYKYVRDTFELALPHPSVVSSWYKTIDGEPGFTKESFDVLSRHAQKQQQAGHQTLCNLTIDEMAIRKHIEWDGKKYRGYVDIGHNIEDDSMPAATEALVFLVVCVNGSWKLPVAYFLLDGLKGKDRANLINICLQRLYEVGVTVLCITCDGAASNVAMFAELGAKMSPDDLQPWFTHPGDNTRKIYVLLDVCHMLKLLRNTFSSQVMVDNNGGQINWNFIKQLHKLQQLEGLRAANRLRTAHVDFFRQKMKVNLAAQVLSNSVAKALEFCLSIDMSQFYGCEATVKFIKTADRLFDILNSKNILAKNFKAPMSMTNKHLWMKFLLETRVYIATLTDTSGRLMTAGKKKTAFVGFLTAIDTMMSLFQDLVVGSPTHPPCLKYLLTFKFSQDHLEIFFGCIRSHLGCNNNPTARQFTAAYKRLLVQNEIKASNSGNCQNTDAVPILNVDQSTVNRQQASDDSVTVCHTIQQALVDHEPIQDEHDYADTPNVVQLSRYIENAVVYIAGYVARNVTKHLPCLTCAEATVCSQYDSLDNSMLLKLRDNGGLTHPSPGTVTVCTEAEKCFKRLAHEKPPAGRGFMHVLVTNVTEQVLSKSDSVFPELHEHQLETEPQSNHVIELVKRIAREYCKIRLYHWGKQHTTLITGPKIRTNLSKLILFKNQ